ncbi:hypothetical protein [Alicyclobacillus acidiphilus]|uniref:hypothetical protein n=1 Tax=Alicyclobacillus acidiphilus TaxID=182455 RepID=UPI000835835C|nr:hypothetical protein [Alicyclobacillus acidiphilus]
MNMLMVVNDVNDIDQFSNLKRYFDIVEDLRLTVLYISDIHEGLCIQEGPNPRYILPDAELQYTEALEEHVTHEFLHWLDRVQFRHEVGEPIDVIRRVMQDERIDVMAVCRKDYDEHALSSLEVPHVMFESDDPPLPLAN